MKLDWNNFELGYLEELEKNAAFRAPRKSAVRPPVAPARKVTPATPAAGANTPTKGTGIIPKAVGATTAAGGLVGAGTLFHKAYQGGQELYNQAGNILGGLLPLGLTAMMAGGGKGRAPGASPTNASLAELLGQKRNILNYDAMDPRSLTAPSAGYGAPKVAEDITGLVAKSLQQRAVNTVIDRVLHKEESPAAKPTEEHELELVSKHPQMKKLLEDEKNKAYLEKLLHE